MSAGCLMTSQQQLRVSQSGPMDRLHNSKTTTLQRHSMHSRSTGSRFCGTFFATSHGKGPVDGIGGSVKRHVWTAVKTRKVIVNDAASFVLACNAPGIALQ